MDLDGAFCPFFTLCQFSGNYVKAESSKNVKGVKSAQVVFTNLHKNMRNN